MRVLILALLIGLSGEFSSSARAVDASLATGAVNGSRSRSHVAIGTWITTGGKSMVKVTRCGSRLCSQIVWLKRPYDSRGRPLRDRRNRNVSLRSRRIIGLPILQFLRRAGKGSWGGRVYNPEDGKTYKVNIYVRSATKLEVRGCTYGGWPCRSRYWRRAGDYRARQKTRSASRSRSFARR